MTTPLFDTYIGIDYSGAGRPEARLQGIQVYMARWTELRDPSGLIEGTGKGMRHVKVWTVADIKAQAFSDLVKQAAALRPKS